VDVRRLLLTATLAGAAALAPGCYHDEPDPGAGLRAEVRRLSSENAWLHARLFEAEASAEAPTACALPPVAEVTRTLGDVRRALAAEIATGEIDVGIVDDAVTFGLPVAVGFAADSATLTRQGEATLERLAAMLRRSPGVGVEIVTTVTGAPLIDMDDWQRAHARAMALAWNLADLGVSADRITVVSRPVVPVPSGPPATATVPRLADVQVVLRTGPPGAEEDQGPMLGVVR
jgi:outer membrane protein OmpA-like peptidoglycan-associated protein